MIKQTIFFKRMLLCFRYEVKMAEALALLDSKKEDEKAVALAALRSSMQKVVDDAVAEKEEFLALYTKVSFTFSML